MECKVRNKYIIIIGLSSFSKKYHYDSVLSQPPPCHGLKIRGWQRTPFRDADCVHFRVYEACLFST